MTKHMIYALLMAIGTMVILVGALFLLLSIVTSSGIPVVVFSLFVIAIGVLIIISAKNQWKSWYNKGVAEIEKSKTPEARQRQAEAARRMRTIVRTSIIGTDSKSKTGSAASRALVGDFVAGPIGGIVGATTAKRQVFTKFLVEYESGRKTVETVKDNSIRFNELVQYLNK